MWTTGPLGQLGLKSGHLKGRNAHWVSAKGSVRPHLPGLKAATRSAVSPLWVLGRLTTELQSSHQTVLSDTGKGVSATLTPPVGGSRVLGQ